MNYVCVHCSLPTELSPQGTPIHLACLRERQVKRGHDPKSKGLTWLRFTRRKVEEL